MPQRDRPTVRQGLRYAAGALLLSGLVLYGFAVAQRVRLDAPAPTPLLLDRQGLLLARFGTTTVDAGGVRRIDYGYWPLEALPERVVAATLALEDRRFWQHPGVDGLAVLRAAWQALRDRQVRSGASTLAMQMVRMQTPAPRTLWNKLVEAGAALVLTQRYGRDAILRQYLRTAPYGNSSHGIAHAARWYFDKSVDDLSWAEIAFLTAIPQAPSRMNPYRATGRQAIVRRGLRMLEQLAAQGVLDPEALRLAQQQLPVLQPLARPARPSFLHALLHIERLWQRDSVAGRRRDPVVRATLDAELQQMLAALVETAWPEWQAQGAEQLAVLVVERNGFVVRAALGSRDYFHSPAGALDFLHTPRSPGSTLKPFLYGLALEQGLLTPTTWLPDQPEGAAGIGNADGRFLGLLLPRQALANSRNVPATHLLRQVGLPRFFELLADLELLPGPQVHAPAHFGLALVLGGLPTTLEQLVRAYGALANDGALPALRWYDGQTLPPVRPVLSSRTARQITLFLADPLARLPSFPRYGPTDYPFAVALKTGTSQGYRDAWIVAWSADYLVGVWLGRSDVNPMRGVSGGRGPAALAHALLLRLHGNTPGDLQELEFPPPADYRPAEVCLTVAVRPGGCAQTLREWLPVEGLPTVASEASAARARLADAPPIGEAPVELKIISPEHNARLWRNPEAPAALARIALKAAVKGPVSQIVWYVDDHPFGIADRGRPLYWPLQKGVHQFEARLPYREERSRPVRVVVE